MNLEGYDPDSVGLMQTDTLTDTMEELFGTPDRPAIPEAVGLDLDLDLDLVSTGAGPAARLADQNGRPGPQRGLYRQHCAACHGMSGDGAGPLALVLKPYPRDFRMGLFKYTSTASGEKPVPDDLKRALVDGNTDTAMPSFRTLPDAQIDALVQYVQYLTIRGETELSLRQTVIEDDWYPLRQMDIDDAVEPLVGMWADAAEMVVEPPSPPPTDGQDQLDPLIARGREIYLGEKGKCFQCHGQEGRGDGEQSDDLYDDWNKPKRGATPEQTKRKAPQYRLPLRRLRPRDFTRGMFRGGDQPIDIYRRVYAGIKGTPMPSGSGALTPEEVWGVVAYVRRLAGRTGEL